MGLIIISGKYGTKGLYRNVWLMYRRAADENDPIVGLPEEKEWTDELEKRLREGTLNEPRRELAPWYVLFSLCLLSRRRG